MDTNAILLKLKESVPGKVLESGRFGRSSWFSIWIDVHSIRAIANAILADERMGLDWLENVSVAEVDNALLVSYFLSSTRGANQVVLRGTVAIKKSDQEVDLPSVRDLWPMAAPFEDEAAELFGIRFLSESGEPLPRSLRLVEEGAGFPLRGQL